MDRILYQGGKDCQNFDNEKDCCSLKTRPFNADYRDVPQKIIEINNTYGEAAGIMMGAELWPKCQYALTYCRSWM